MADQNFRVSPGLEIGTGNTAVTISAGIVTATGGFNIGIQSSGTSVTTGVVTALNFTGAGNTFSYNSETFQRPILTPLILFGLSNQLINFKELNI